MDSLEIQFQLMPRCEITSNALKATIKSVMDQSISDQVPPSLIQSLIAYGLGEANKNYLSRALFLFKLALDYSQYPDSPQIKRMISRMTHLHDDTPCTYVDPPWNMLVLVALNCTGCCHRRMQKIKEAKVALKAAYHLCPEDTETLVNLSLVYQDTLE